jgi:hypothetical protein
MIKFAAGCDLPVPVPPISTALRCSAKKAPLARSRISPSLTEDGGMAPLFYSGPPFPSGARMISREPSSWIAALPKEGLMVRIHLPPALSQVRTAIGTSSS